MSEYEHLLWPAKILDAPIPSFIIPIQPHWAQHLFDEGLAKQDLFGAREDLALNHEGVYYRSSHSAGLTAPGRILWYVSNRAGYQGVGMIRACSRLDEVIVGQPKELFGRFRRLGVYEWKNVFNTAGDDLQRNIMALRFSDTLLFPRPITLKSIQTVLAQKITFQSPRRISGAVFAQLYLMAIPAQVEAYVV